MFAVAANPGPGAKAAGRDILGTGAVLDWLAGRWGRYPFSSGGGVLADKVAGLETATHPIYGAYVWSSEFKKPFPQWNVVVHENAHQWFADSVTPANWSYFWLSEGFATYNEWLWSEQHGSDGAADAFAQMWARFPAGSPLWTTHIGELRDFAEWANGAEYFRGAMALQALRVRLGPGWTLQPGRPQPRTTASQPLHQCRKDVRLRCEVLTPNADSGGITGKEGWWLR
jgi:hypothetical protein